MRLLGLSNHCNLTSCSIDGGLQLVDAEHVRIENCVINGGEDAIDLLRVDGITIEECTVTSTQFDGIQVYSGNNVEISDCTVEGRTKLLYSYHSNLIDCTFKKGVDTYIAHFCEIRNNDISSELHLYDSGYNRIEDNRFSNGWVDISGENNRISAFVLDFSNNTIDGKLIGYYFNTTEMDVDATNIGSVIVADCDDMKCHGGSLIGPVDFIWSNNTELTECTLSQNASLTVEDAINVTIAHNVIDTYGARIHIEDVLYITIEFNDVTLRCVDDGYSYMINSYYVDYTEFKNNSITITGTPDVGHDIQLDETNEVIFTGNTVQARDMRMHGHYLEFADNQFQCSVILESVGDLNILRNTFENSQDTGLNLESAYNVTIIGNKFLHNGKYGMELTHCDFCTIYNNSLGWNEEDNAYDNHGSNNIWDDGVSVGNAWSDYDGSGVYEIWGSSNSVDRYPSILLPTTTTTNGDFPVDILMLVGLISVIGIVVVVIVAIRLRSK